MSNDFTIKITGVRSQIGHNGGVQFQVCTPDKGWVAPSFASSPYDDGGWLLLDQSVFITAQAIFLSTSDQTATACLVLGGGGCDTTTLQVDDVRMIWRNTPS